jgi:hypothetical protein
VTCNIGLFEIGIDFDGKKSKSRGRATLSVSALGRVGKGEKGSREKYSRARGERLAKSSDYACFRLAIKSLGGLGGCVAGVAARRGEVSVRACVCV